MHIDSKSTGLGKGLRFCISFFFLVFIFERERERERESTCTHASSGEEQREGDRRSEVGSVRTAESLMQGLNSQTVRL